MPTPDFRAAILVVSTTASKDPSTDFCVEALKDVFENQESGIWEVSDAKIVSDEVLDIQRSILAWADAENPVNLIVTTGGTGFAVSDVTPEAVTPLLHKQAPGLVHGMLATSLDVTPFAVMSRTVAGVRKNTIIITLPGSPKASRENLRAIVKLLPHACKQAAGADSRQLHAGGVERLEKEAGVWPGPHALRLIEQFTPSPSSTMVMVDGNMIGNVLAENVTATEAVPAYRASTVDGYAVIAQEDGSSSRGVFPVASISHASPVEVPPLGSGQVARITTGAPLPPGANAVVMVEDTNLKSATLDGKEELEVEIMADNVKPGENVREIGSDIEDGEVILRKGTEISTNGGELGLLASVGKAEVAVYKKPVVGILSTGDEIVQHSRPGSLRLGEVRDCNRPTLMAAVKSYGFEAVDLGIARDTPGDLEQKLRDAFQEVDVIITSGGVSMGELDLLKPTIERSLGGTIHFGRVSMKPGKPTTFATVTVPSKVGSSNQKLIFSLPGNPVSAIVTFHLFVLPSLHFASGISPAGLPKILVTLGHDFRLDPQRPEYHRAIATIGTDGLIYAKSTGRQRSSRVGSLKSANALLCLPTGKAVLEKGAQVKALLMGKLGSELAL
ncbi:hypothetical protein OIDMADRAFT_165010 [Oidiodendron maius Zn]|uniref:MoaB/Mog domain-containing protein n=1 Tax=Oidiodendron maius (strain Zn) TaxID=913774 RepID=A0A0C3GWL1_OIDMZ|nr:hypothetical protein OIDMADRAFT_165010 [Oidiodendron maius Zn]